MSVATLDFEVALDRKSSGESSSGEKRVNPNRSGFKAPASMMWGFDEAAEREKHSRVLHRLIRLEAMLFDEYGTRIDASSRDALMRLFVGCPTVRQPSISAQPNGQLTASWRLDGGEELAIRCVSKDVIHYSLSTRAAGGGRALNRQWGTFHSVPLFFKENLVARRIAE
jgi:hypothetical protein